VSPRRAIAAFFALGLALAPARARAEGEPPGSGAHAQPHGGEGHGEEGEAPGSINWFDFSNKEEPPYAALLINFGLLAYGYYRFGKKPVADALQKNRDSIAKEIEEAQRMKREAEGRAKQYQAKLQHLEAELAETRQALEQAGKAEHDRIVKEAEEKAARMQKDAAFLLEQEGKQLRLDLQREAVTAALAAAEELLKKRVTGADQERLAEEFLASLEKRESMTGRPVGDKAGRT
jgi:F0F1-type ATP synthase membrane subunit b/b'